MATNHKMATSVTAMSLRPSSAKEDGYYRRFLAGDCVVEYLRENVSAEDDIFEVERLIERRIFKGKEHFLVLWKDYPKEDATWIESSDVTETAIQLFLDPQPPVRLIMDSVSIFTVSLQESLTHGIVRKRTISLEFPRYVFNFLFNNKGSPVRRKPGRLYERSDFSSTYFCDSTFAVYNKHKEGVAVVFPVYMYSHVKFSKQHYDSSGQPLPRSFTETLFIKITKIRI